MGRDLFEHIQRLSLRFFERWGTGEIISRMTNDIHVLQQAINGGTIDPIVGVFNMVAFAIIMLLLNWQLALLVFVTAPALVVASAITAEMLRVRYRAVQEKSAEVNNVLQENISGVRVSKAFAREGDAAPRASTTENRGNLRANMSTAGGAGHRHARYPDDLRLSAWPDPVVGGTWQILNGTLTVGTLVAFVSYLIQFYQPVEDLIRVNNTLQQALAAAERIFEFIDEQPDVADRPGAPPDAGARRRARRAFEDVDLRLRAGQAGAARRLPRRPGRADRRPGRAHRLGQDHVVNLIPRFYDPDGGRVTVDGHDLRDVTLHCCATRSPSCSRRRFLFGATVRDNIRYGRLDATDAEVEAAARQAHAHEFIVAAPGRLRTGGRRGGRAASPAGSASASPSPGPSSRTRAS